MTLRPRFVHFLLVAACACAAVTTSPFANSQSPAKPHEREAQPVSQPQADEKPDFGDNDGQRRMAYPGFLQLVGTGEQSLKTISEAGEVDNSRQVTSWMKALGIRENEVRVMLIIAGDAWHRIEEIDDQGNKNVMEFDRNPTKENSDKTYAHGKELGRERTEIVDETISKLRQELGEEDFRKLDAWIYRTSSEGAAMNAKRREKDAERKQAGEDSNPAPAKEPQL